MNIPDGSALTVGAHRSPPACATGGIVSFLSPEALTDKARAVPLLRRLSPEALRDLAAWCLEEADTRQT